jgi:ubiquinone/menaquinone biosynthesis C-methylase UbiE
MTTWPDYDRSFIRRRYNSISRRFVFYEWLFLLPSSIRDKAVSRLELKAGDRVLELGCGTGRNLSLLYEAVGPAGHIYGVDLSEGMLAEAKQVCADHGWQNVTLIHSDAAEYMSPMLVDGILFSLSYATMPHHEEVLRQAWEQLHRGKYLVIMDAQFPSGRLGRFTRPFHPMLVWLLKGTVLGNPYIAPRKELAEVAGGIESEELAMGTYFICRAKKR